MGKPDIACALSSDAFLEQARDVRARAWRYVFDCYQAKQKAGVPSTGYDGKEPKNVPDNPILPQ